MIEQKQDDMKRLFISDAMRSQSGLAKSTLLGLEALSTCTLHLQDLGVAVRMMGWSELERQVDTWSLLLKEPSLTTWSMLTEWVADLGYFLEQAAAKGLEADASAMSAWQGRLDTHQLTENAPPDTLSNGAGASQDAKVGDEVSAQGWRSLQVNIGDGLHLLRQIRRNTKQKEVLLRTSALQDWLFSLQHIRLSEIGSPFTQEQECGVGAEVAQRLTEHLPLLSNCAPLISKPLGHILRLELARVDPQHISALAELSVNLHGQLFEDEGHWVLQFPTESFRTTIQPFSLHGDKYAVLSSQLVRGVEETHTQLTLRSGTQTRTLEVEQLFSPLSAQLFWVPDWVKRPPWLNAIALDDSDQTYLCVIPK